MSPQESHHNTQQDESNKAPKYPSPGFMAATVLRRMFRRFIHWATANSIVLMSVAFSTGARELLTRFDTARAAARIRFSVRLIKTLSLLAPTCRH